MAAGDDPFTQSATACACESHRPIDSPLEVHPTEPLVAPHAMSVSYADWQLAGTLDRSSHWLRHVSCDWQPAALTLLHSALQLESRLLDSPPLLPPPLLPPPPLLQPTAIAAAMHVMVRVRIVFPPSDAIASGVPASPTRFRAHLRRRGGGGDEVSSSSRRTIVVAARGKCATRLVPDNGKRIAHLARFMEESPMTLLRISHLALSCLCASALASAACSSSGSGGGAEGSSGSSSGGSGSSSGSSSGSESSSSSGSSSGSDSGGSSGSSSGASEGDSGSDAGACPSAPKLYGDTPTSIYCLYNAMSMSLYCPSPSNTCCLGGSNTSICAAAGSTCPSPLITLNCEGDAQCGTGQVCCASGQKPALDQACGFFRETGMTASSCVTGTTCPGGLFHLCGSTAECPTCTAFKPVGIGDSLGFCN